MEKLVSVKYLLEQIKNKVEPAFAMVYVVGEVSNFRGSGRHWYFTLKEEGAALQCAIWFRQQNLLKYIPKDGDRIRVKGSLSLYVVGGTITLSVLQCVLDGVGDLQVRLRQLEMALRAKGVFSRPKRLLPKLPGRIGVIAALGGAALWDVIKVTKRRAPGVHILVAPAAAQGDRAVAENLLALQEIQNQFWACDVILMVRGGGSLEDLWSYNDPELVYAVADCCLPVVTGIGHEIDTSLVDLAADVRAATPSQAAELVTPDRKQLSNIITSFQDRLLNYMAWRLHRLETSLNLLIDSKGMRSIPERLGYDSLKLSSLVHRIKRCLLAGDLVTKLNTLVYRLHLVHPSKRLDGATNHLQLLLQKLMYITNTLGQDVAIRRFLEASYSLNLVMTKTLTTYGTRLEIVSARLKATDPRGPLERGFVLVFATDGKPITKASAIVKDSRVALQWLDGKHLATID